MQCFCYKRNQGAFVIFVIFILQDVSPDTEDPEAAGDTAGEAAANKEANQVNRLIQTDGQINIQNQTHRDGLVKVN